MDKSIRRQLKIALCAVLFLSYAALATTFEFRSPLTLVWPLMLVLCMPLGEWLDRRFTHYRTVTTGLTVIVSAMLLATMGYNGLLYTLTFLLIYIQSYSMLHKKEEQTYNHILLMSFFMLLAAAVLSPSANIGFVLILFVIAASWMLLLLEVGMASQSAKVIRVEDLVDAGAGTRNPGIITRLLDLRMAGWIMAFSMLLLISTAIIFAAVPRTEAGLLGTMVDDTTFTTGMGDEIQLGLRGTITGDASPVMQVWFPDSPDGTIPEEMYWRVTTLDHYEGNLWSRRGLISRGSSRDEKFRRFYGEASMAERGGGIQRSAFNLGRLVHYTAFIDQLPDTGVPALQTVRGMRAIQGKKFAPVTWDATGDFTVHITLKGDKAVEIEAWSEVYVPTEEELRASSDDYMAVMVPSDYRLLTQQNLTPQTLELVEEITQGLENPFEQMEALEAYLTSEQFTYTNEIPELSQENPIDSFILNVRAGHCELYASALTMMARSQGIPARMVKGYRGGIWDQSDKAYTVVNNMAHVWVEVHFPDIGWVTYDPSPPTEDLGLFSMQGVSRSYSKWAMKARMFWLQSVIGYTPSEQYLFFKESTFQIFRSFGIGGADEENIARTSWLGKFGTLLVWLSTAALLLGMAFLVFRIWNRLSRVEGPQLSHEQRRAKKLIKDLHQRLTGLGIETHGLTAEEMAELARKDAWCSDDDLPEILQMYNQVRFGDAPLSPEEYKILSQRVRKLTIAAPQT